MKVAMQESALGVHPPLSTTTVSPVTVEVLDIKNVCQSQVEQLAAQLPVLAIWIAYYEPDRGKRQTVANYCHEHYFPLSALSYLHSEAWWVNSLPVLKLSEVPIEGSHYAYVCPIRHSGLTPEYLLLYTQNPLSDFDRERVEQRTQLVSNYMTVYKECCRQRAEVQLLEQVMHKAEHQLRNPLALIALYAENLCLSLPAGSLQDQASIIRETVNELSANLTQYVNCGLASKLRFVPYDLRAIVMETIKGLQPWIEKKQLHISYPSQAAIAAVDPWQMKQVFDNLLSNAIHFSPDSGLINCHWQVFQDELIVEVSDRGPGLSEEDLTQAFTPYYSRRPGGTGLGLAIAKKIVLDHQGSLWVQNLSSGGAQFSFTLPRHQI